MSNVTYAELYDIHSIAENDLTWALLCLNAVKTELEKTENLMQSNGIKANYLGNAKDLISMFDYLLVERAEYHEKCKLDAELKAKGLNNE